jgi:hypothetical protein
MYIYVYICVYICVYIYMYIYIYSVGAMFPRKQANSTAFCVLSKLL